jgi:hypothetical protein
MFYMNNSFQKLLSEHIGLSLVKQQALSSLLGEHSWSLNLEKGVVDFGEDRIFPIQFVGTESEKTWLWGWANSLSNISQNLLVEANKLRAYGDEHQIAFLSNAEIPLTEISGHDVGMLASGFCNADGYYHGSHDGGAVVFLVYETSLPKIPILLPQQIVLTIASALQSFEIEHRTMVLSFLKQLGCDVDESERLIEGKLADGQKLVIGLDDLNRITKIEIQQG